MAFQTRTSPQKRLFTIIRTLIDLDRVSIEITKDTDTSFEFYVRCGFKPVPTFGFSLSRGMLRVYIHVWEPSLKTYSCTGRSIMAISNQLEAVEFVNMYRVFHKLRSFQ